MDARPRRIAQNMNVSVGVAVATNLNRLLRMYVPMSDRNIHIHNTMHGQVRNAVSNVARHVNDNVWWRTL